MYILLLVFFSFLNLAYAIRTGNHFSVDDFQVLKYFKSHTIIQMIPDFILHGDMFGYRKWVGHLVFGGLFKIFGAQANAFMITIFLIHSANLILLFLIVRYLTKRNFIAFFSALIFNKFYLFYFSNLHEYMGALFCLAATYIFLRYPKKVFLAVGTYALALFSKELTYSLPFFLLAISYVKKIDIKRTYPFLILLGIYGLYQAYFLFVLKSTSFLQSYGFTLNFDNLSSSIFFYLSPLLIFALLALPLIVKKYKVYSILAVGLMTLAPVLFFGARREPYYLYIPMVYILTYIALTLPKLSLKSATLYIVILLVFGGRSVFPRIAWQTFPDWQKVSMDNVVKKVETSLSGNPKVVTIDLSGTTLERDARLMLEHGDLDLFVAKDVSERYNFDYNEGDNVVVAKRI